MRVIYHEPTEIDETDYLLSTEANRQHLKEALESLKNPDNYIYIDPAKL
jgi:antitoxin YefM